MMFLNVICSILIIPLIFLVCIIFILRKVGKKRDKDNWVNRWNRSLRKKHIPLGIALFVFGLFHAVWASIEHGFSFSWGWGAAISLVLLLASYLLRKLLKSKWMLCHRVLTVAFLLCVVMHLTSIPAGGGMMPNGNFPPNRTPTTTQQSGQ